MARRISSYSKINLGLAIGPARPDGFHELVTVYQTLALCDLVTVTARRAPETRITIHANHAGVPCDERNTAWKMAALALARARVRAEVSIEIEKRLPLEGGLGAGSANAAAALAGLTAELGLELSGAVQLELAEEVGSDVPLFLVGGTVLGLGRGEQVYPLPEIEPRACVVAVPEMGVSTAQAFRDWDGLAAERALTVNANHNRLKQLSRAVAAGFSGVSALGGDLAGNPLLALVRTGIENDFEQVVFPLHPRLREIKQRLEEGAVYAALSGSGSALFGLYAEPRAAGEARSRLEAAGVKAVLTRTISRRELRQDFAEETAPVR